MAPPLRADAIRSAEMGRTAGLAAAAAGRGAAASVADDADLGAILDRIGDGFVALDRDLNYTYVNASAVALLGRADLLGRNVLVEFPGTRESAFSRGCRDALLTGIASQVEFFYPSWERWFEIRIYPSADGLSVFFTEITERKRIQATAAASENRLALVFDTVGDVLFLLAVEPGEVYRFASVNA